jgi:hydroxyacylglutathione hydrolase
MLNILNVRPIPLLDDNYAYLLTIGTDAVLVDPSDAAPVQAILDRENLNLRAIFCTHHHWDHVGGVEGLWKPGVEVHGSRYDQDQDRIPHQTHAWTDGAAFNWAGQSVELLHVPGHTLGAVCFLVNGEEAFTGDTLFLSGCGRLFEGTAAQLRASLARLRALPGKTRIWCGHEYASKNLKFAASIEPGSAAVLSAQGRLAGVSVPGLLEAERAQNPFLRWDMPDVQAAVSAELPGMLAPGATPEEVSDAVFALLRRRRDGF